MGVIDGIVLYGAGRCCERTCAMLEKSDIRILAIVDSDKNKQGKELAGHIIESPEELIKYTDEYLCICIADPHIVKDIRDTLEKIYHYPKDNIIEYSLFRKYMHISLYSHSEKTQRIIAQREEKRSSVKNIVFDCYNGLGLGGIEAWTMDLCICLLQHSWKHISIMSDHNDYEIPAIITGIVDKVALDKNHLFEEESFYSVFQYLLSKVPCIIVTGKPSITLLAACVLKKFFLEKIKIISVIHIGNRETYKEYMLYKDEIDIYIGVSQDIQRGMCQNGVNPGKVLAMTCPFECDKELSRAYTTDETLPIKIGYAGRMDGMEKSQKRMDLLLQLIELLDRNRVNFQFELAGDGVAKSAMEEFINVHRLDKKVTFLGQIERSKIKDFWQKQDICVNVADCEGRSISIIEAMGNGAIPIVTHVSGVSEDIVNNENGFIVPLRDIETMAERISYLSIHRERLRQMGMLAHDIIYPKSLMEPHVKFWEGIFECYGYNRQSN